MPQSYFNYYSAQQKKGNPVPDYKTTVSREFYLADAYLKGDLSSMKLDYKKCVAGSLPIFKSSCVGHVTCGVKRTWKDIRKDSKQFCLLWFPIAGVVRISQNNLNVEVTPSEFAITYANSPLKVEVEPDEVGKSESYQVAVPIHLMNSYLPHAEKLGGKSFPVDKGNISFAKKTYISLYDEAENMSQKAIESFVTASLETIAEALGDECRKQQESFDIKAVRLKTVLDYIDFHLSDPGLTASRVAEECGISSRYVHFLFKQSGMTFRDYTWNKRLGRAHEWLVNGENRNETISHIAFTAGYRSVSHFSRSFKAAYGYTPTQARTRGQDRPSAP